MVTGSVLVTGATGGLGRILVAELRNAGRDIIATGRNRDKGAQLQAANVRFIQADLEHDDLTPLCDGIDTIFHLAALSAPWGQHAAFVATNFTATSRLLDIARRSECSRLIFASTPSIYTTAKHQFQISETSQLPRRYVNSYAETKHAAERNVLAASTEQFNTVVLRPRAVIGPYDTILLPRLLRAAEKGTMLLPGWGKALIELTHARDAARAFMAAESYAAAVNGRAFNISGGVPLPLVELVRKVLDRLEYKVRLFPVPARLGLSAGTLLEKFGSLRSHSKEPSLTRYSAMALGWSQTFDLTAAREALRWEPRHSPFEAIDWALSEIAHA